MFPEMFTEYDDQHGKVNVTRLALRRCEIFGSQRKIIVYIGIYYDLCIICQPCAKVGYGIMYNTTTLERPSLLPLPPPGGQHNACCNVTLPPTSVICYWL